MGEVALSEREVESGSFAWLVPLAAVPIAVLLTYGSVGEELLREGPLWMGGLAVLGLLASLHSARVVAASAKDRGPPVALALLPFTLPQLGANALAHLDLQGHLHHGTYCGPASREEVITWGLADTLLLQVAALFISCAGALCVCLSAVMLSAEHARRVRWVTIAATLTMSWSFAISALGVVFVRARLGEMLEMTFDSEGTWLRRVVAQFNEYESSANTLLLSALVFAASALALSTRERLQGAVTFAAVALTLVGVRGGLAFDRAQLGWTFDAYPMFETLRPAAGADLWYSQGDIELNGSSLFPAHREVTRAVKDTARFSDSIRPVDDPEFAGHHRAARAAGLPFAGPALIAPWRRLSDGDLRVSLQTLRQQGVSDVVLASPLPQFAGAPRALRALVEYQDSFDQTAPLSVRFLDEEACRATTVRPELVATETGESPWEWPCETVGLEEVTTANLYGLSSRAVARQHRLVVLVPRR